MKASILVRAILMTMALPAASAMAAPLDVFLTTKITTDGKLKIEAAYDAVNNTLDVLKIRAKDPQYGGTTVGDYSGYHVRAAYGLTKDLAVEGELWQRKISNPGDSATIDSWKVSGQYRFYGSGKPVDLALRLGAWGDSAGTLRKMTPTQVFGQTAQTITVNSPKDLQLQADLIGTWALTSRLDWSGFLGAGSSQVEVAGLSATATSGGCNFNLTFTQTTAIAQLAAPCGGLLQATLVTPTTALQELTYRSLFYQAGTNVRWHKHGWEVSAGYLFRHLKRQNVDSLIAARGGIAYPNNQLFSLEISNRLTRNITAFARGQAMTNQFVGEIPFTYNGFTASKFGRLYGYASFGAVMTF